MPDNQADRPEGVEWAGRSARDQAIRHFLETRVPWAKTRNEQLPVTLLLGPRGSGKTTLLRYLDDVSVELPHARLDLATFGKEGNGLVDVLTQLSIQLHERRKGFPRFEFPAFGTAAIAMSATFDGAKTANAAAQAILNAMAAADAESARQLTKLADAAALVLPAPAMAVLRALPALRNVWLRHRIRRQFRHLRHPGRRGSNWVDRLIRLRFLLDSGDPDEQWTAESELLGMFLADLRREYRASLAVSPPPARCVLLLDNVDGELGNRFLQLLLEVRESVEEGMPADPLLILATAGSYPRAIRDDRWVRISSGRDRWRWDTDSEEFRPERARQGLDVGQLRDLRQSEVELQARSALREIDRRQLPVKAENGVRWLGWAVHQVTHGHPAATARVLHQLRAVDGWGFDGWDDRLRRVMAPDSPLIGELLDRLLPLGASEELVRVLPYAAASVEPTQAEVAGLIGPPDSAVRKEFEAFSRNVLHTMHIDDDDPTTDGPPETLHPMLRLLLLQRLAAADEMAWTTAHKELRRAAELAHGPSAGVPDEMQDGPPAGVPAEVPAGPSAGVAGGPDSSDAAMYHALALGDVRAAAIYLHDRFGQGEEAEAVRWCESLCRLRRAPMRGLGTTPESSPSERYERLLEFLDEGPVENRLRTVSRLLAAIWLAPEPPTDPRTDRVGDPFRNPLGDPGAELYGEVVQRLKTLAYAHGTNAVWSRVLKNKAAQYEGNPW